MFNYHNQETNEPIWSKIIPHLILGLITLIFLLSSFGIVAAGERGVKTRLGPVVAVLEPGLYFRLPIIEKVRKINIKTQSVLYEREEPLAAASKDLQDVQIATVVNYHVNASEVEQVYTKYGNQDAYEAQVIRPAVRDVVKATASQFTAEELVTKRAEFTDTVILGLNERLSNKFATVEQVNITNFKFSESFSKAIELKVTAEQEALAAKNKLEQIRYEAEQRIAQARGEAEAIKIQSQAISSQGGEDYVNLKAIEKWNGQLPTNFVPGSAIPFINLPN